LTTESSEVPDNLMYSTEHEWLLVEGDQARVGITDYAQDQLGDIVYVDLPKVGGRTEFMKKFGEIESVKVASEIFAPVSGEVVEVNGALADTPELVNKDSYGEGWLVVIRMSDAAESDKLLSAEAYRDLIRREQGETS
jgi:glycine cleavage system H protein